MPCVHPNDLRRQVHDLQRLLQPLLSGWTLVACSSCERFLATTALLLEPLQLTASSTAELLALPLPETGRLLVLCDDDGADGGAAELMTQLKSVAGAERCRFLICVDAAIRQPRLELLWQGGVNGLCCRERCGTGGLLSAVVAVLRGQICLDPQLSDRLRQPTAACCLVGHRLQLSARERELILMLAHGRSAAEIAALLQLRCDTVRRQLSVLYRRTGVTNQRALIAWGLEHGLLRPQDLVCQLS